jgi:hypothetical protein
MSERISKQDLKELIKGLSALEITSALIIQRHNGRDKMLEYVRGLKKKNTKPPHA